MERFLILLTFLTLPLFFYKLGQSSLVSFDEAWYGGVAQNIIKTGDFLNLTWNGNPYNDHPPAGFWLMAASIKIMGDSEFAVRFPAALLGFLSLIIIYFLGKELFGSRVVGFASALALSSSFWFLFRTRSGNLDVTLTFFFLLTLLLALKKILLPWSVSLTLLFLTKTLVPFTIIPSLFVIFGRKFPWKYFFLSVTLFSIWLILNMIKNTNFINHYLGIGLPGVDVKTNYLDNFTLIKDYLHSGIGKWFWPGILSIFLSLFLRQKRFLILTIFFITLFTPFVFSQKGHIWHLIPLYPILILSFLGFFLIILQKIIKNKIITSGILLGVVIYVSIFQIQIAWRQFIDIPPFISDEAILSREASKFNEPLFIDGDFQQAAIYYAKKNVKKISRDELKALFKNENKFLMITHRWRLDEANINSDKYQVIKADRDKILIIKK